MLKGKELMKETTATTLAIASSFSILLTIVACGIVSAFAYKAGLEKGREKSKSSYLEAAKSNVYSQIAKDLKYFSDSKTMKGNSFQHITELLYVYQLNDIRTIVLKCDRCKPNLPVNRPKVEENIP